MHQIFISYRRDGGEAMAQLLHDRLANRGFKVFYDIESLKSGPFDTKIYDKIEECTDFLLVLPPQSLDRCVYDEDWVRNEIRHALRCEKNIIPIMLRGFVFPDRLPDDIVDIKRCNGVAFENMEYLDARIDRIISMLVSKASNGEISNQIKNDVATEKSTAIIGNVCSIGSNDLNNCWPTGHYSPVINRDEYSVIYFHLTVAGIPVGTNKITSGFKIYNGQNQLIFNDVTEFDWQDGYDRIARSWIVKGDDGSFVPEGEYIAEFWVNGSGARRYRFTVTAGSDDKSQGFFGKIKKLFS